MYILRVATVSSFGGGEDGGEESVFLFYFVIVEIFSGFVTNGALNVYTRSELRLSTFTLGLNCPSGFFIWLLNWTLMCGDTLCYGFCYPLLLSTILPVCSCLLILYDYLWVILLLFYEEKLLTDFACIYFTYFEVLSVYASMGLLHTSCMMVEGDGILSVNYKVFFI